MARSPMWKVYSGQDYRASCKHAEDAACLVAFLGDGATIRAGHTLIVWREGQESQAASESYDHVASVVHQRYDHVASVVHQRLEQPLEGKEIVTAKRQMTVALFCVLVFNLVLIAVAWRSQNTARECAELRVACFTGESVEFCKDALKKCEGQ